MRLARYLLHTAVEVVRYGTADRRYGLIVVVLVGALIVAIAMAVHTVAPIALYPFA